MPKPFAEKTGIGKFLSKLAPNILGLVGEFPGAGLLSKLVNSQSNLTPDAKLEAEKLIKHYEEVELIEHYKDVQNARNLDVEKQKSEFASKISKVGPYIIDFIIIGATVLLSTLLFVFEIPIKNEKLAYLAVGSLFTLSTTIISFHRGSSQSSKDKSKFMEFITKKG